MVGKHLKMVAVGLVALGTLGVPANVSAQRYRYADDDRPRVVSRCDESGRARYARRTEYDRYRYERYRPAERRTYYYERRPRRSKAKSALTIAGSAATGAGIGGALRGGKGALIGAAIGGGAASIYEGARRR